MDELKLQPQAEPATATPSRFLKYGDNPLVWGEAFLVNRDGTPRRYRHYQEEDLLCSAPRIAHLDGRSVGKTINLATALLCFTNVHKGKSVLVVAPYQGQLDTIIDEVEFQLNNAPALREVVAREADGKRKIKHHPYFQVSFTSRSKAYFRPAGTRGDSFRSLHVDFLLVDEAAWIPDAAWDALRQCLNAGGKFRVYSTPNGLRDTTYYRITQGKEWRLFCWPSWIAPDWTAARRQELLDFYGGEHTAGWLHEVAGQHGMPTYGAFNAAEVMRAVTDLPDYRKIVLAGEMLADCSHEAAVRERLENLLAVRGDPGRYWLGGDLGYTSDPTELLLFREEENEVLTLALRVRAEHVPYPTIAEIIGLLDRLYNPVGLGFDRGGNGAAVEHELLSLDKFRDQHFTGRLVAYDFGGTLVVGQDGDGNAVRRRMKEESTRVINRGLARGKLHIPLQDPEVEDQLCTQTYVLSDRCIVYSKGKDHIVDAMRCALLRRAQEIDPAYDPVEIIVNVRPVHIGRELP
jgi:hypothetical protein